MGCIQSKPADTHDGSNKGLAYISAFPNGAPKPPPPRTPEAELEDLELNASGQYDDDDSDSEHLSSSSDDDLFLEDNDDNNLASTSKGRSSGKSSSFRRTNKLNVGILEGTTFLNNYIVVDTLGRGSFGKVKLCLSIEDDSLYAVKVVDKRLIKQVAKARQMNKRFGYMKAPTSHGNAGHAGSSGDHLADLRREVDIMRALNHPNLVKLYEVIDDKVSGKILMVVEFCEAGALVNPGQLTPERRMPEAIAQFYFRQMVSGIAYLHENSVIHGDMKPENVLLAGDSTVKIADFGQSQFMSGGEDTLRRTLGTPAFLAPEICAGEDYRGRPADVWALGVSLYGFIYGELPFKGDSLMELYEDIADASVPFPPSVAVSIELQDLLLRTLHKDPEARITAAELLTHPWVREDDLFTLMPSLFSEEAMMDGFGGFGEAGVSPRAISSPRGASPKIAGSSGSLGVAVGGAVGGGGGGKSVSSDDDRGDGAGSSNPSSSAPASRTASDATTTLPSPGHAAREAPSPADVAAAVFPSLFSMRRKNTSGSSGKSTSGKRKGIAGVGGGVGGGSGDDLEEERGAFTLGPQESILGALQQAHAPNKLLAHPSNKLHLLATDSMVRKSLERNESGDGEVGGGDGGGGDVSSTRGQELSSSSGKNIGSEIQRQDTGHPASFSASTRKEEKKTKRVTVERVQEEAGVAAGVGGAAYDANAGEEKTSEETTQQHAVELSKPSAFTVMAQQAQKIQAELIAKQNNNSNNLNTSSTAADVSSSSTATTTAPLGLRLDDVKHSGKLETIGEGTEDEFTLSSSTIPTIDQQYSSLLTVPSDSYEIIDAPAGHAVGPPPLPQVTEADEKVGGQEQAHTKQKRGGVKIVGKSEITTMTSADAIPSPGSSGLMEMTWTTSSGVQQSSQSLTFGFGSVGSSSLPMASPFETNDLKTAAATTTTPSFVPTSTSGGGTAAPVAATGGSTSEKKGDVENNKTAAEMVKATAAALTNNNALPTTTTTEKDGAGSAGGGEIEQVVENPPSSASASAATAIPSSSPPRNMMYNFLHRMSFRGSGESTREPREDSEPAPAPPPAPAPALSSLPSGASTRPEIPPIQWRVFQPGQKLGFASSNHHNNTVYYIESGMVELRWEATLAVPLTRVLSTMQHPSHKFKESTSTNSTISNTSGGGGSSNARPSSSNDAYMHRLDSVALASNKVTTLQAGVGGSGRPGSAGNNKNGGNGINSGMDRSETMANTLQQAAERAEALMVNATGGSLDNLLLSHRGASQFVGALSMLDPDFFADRWKASAIAQTELVVIQMTREGLDDFLSQNPLAQVHLRASMARGQAEITKLEALERIADAHRRKRYVKPVVKKPSWKLSDMRGAFGVTMAEATEVALGPLSEMSKLSSSKPAREGDASSAQETAGLDVFALVSKLRNETQGMANWTDLLGGGGK